MRLIGVEGEPIGIVKIEEAMRLAEENDIDLVEIAPTAKPPVARLMDYGKFKYRESKKAHEAKLKQKQIQVKEVKFRPGTDEGAARLCEVRGRRTAGESRPQRRGRCDGAEQRDLALRHPGEVHLGRDGLRAATVRDRDATGIHKRN